MPLHRDGNQPCGHDDDDKGPHCNLAHTAKLVGQENSMLVTQNKG